MDYLGPEAHAKHVALHVNLDRTTFAVTVMALTPSGAPAHVRFEFETPLEHPARTWILWQDQTPRVWQPPPMGGEQFIPGQMLFEQLPLMPLDS